MGQLIDGQDAATAQKAAENIADKSKRAAELSSAGDVDKKVA